jgi:hypothetical protein
MKEDLPFKAGQSAEVLILQDDSRDNTDLGLGLEI